MKTTAVKQIEALLHYLNLSITTCNICSGSGKSPLDYWDKDASGCIECGGTGWVIHEVY